MVTKELILLIIKSGGESLPDSILVDVGWDSPGYRFMVQ